MTTIRIVVSFLIGVACGYFAGQEFSVHSLQKTPFSAPSLETPLTSGLLKDEIHFDISKINSLRGQFGEVRVEKNSNSPLGRSAFLNNEKIIENDHVGFQNVFPDSSKPEIILMFSNCGGSGCGRPHAVFVDVSLSPPYWIELQELVAETTNIKPSDNGEFLITGTATYIANKFGDLLPIRLSYTRKNRSLRFLPGQETSYDYSKFVGEHPDTLFGDKLAREIFLSKMSPEELGVFRANTKVASAIVEQGMGRYVVGEGMAPHSGGNPSTFFVIDILTGRFLTATYEDYNITVVTDAGYDLLSQEGFANFLKRHKMKWNYDLKKAVMIE